MQKSKTSLLVVAMLAVPSLAFAGRPERDFQRDTMPKIGEAKAALRTACGCEPNITVNFASYPNVGKMGPIRSTLEALATIGTEYCTAAEEKAIFCRNVRQIEIKYNANGCTATIANNKLTLETAECYTDSSFVRTNALDPL